VNYPDAVVVIGASGFIGRNVVEALRERVQLVVGVNSTGAPVPGCHRTSSLTDMASIAALPARTIIVHVAACRYSATRFCDQQAQILSTNMALTDAVYRFALDRGITEIRAASSSAVYPAAWMLQDDSVPLDFNAWPHDVEAAYAWSKRWGEIAAELWRRRAGVHTINFRLTNPYGPHDTLNEADAHVATAFIIRSLGKAQKFEIRGDPNAERDFVFATDIAAAFLASLALEEVDVSVNLAQGTTTRLRDLAMTVMEIAGTPGPLLTGPEPPGSNASIKVRRATARKLHEVLPGLAPFHSLADGLRTTIDWYRNALRG
jgi:nucleoside-diphosphate-sugar epimerase